jgi:hypothetical protein
VRCGREHYILWNTLYINVALDQLAGEGYSVQPEDLARLSPLVFEHMNLLGRYAFSVPDSVVWRQLRPLRDAADALANAFRGCGLMLWIAEL